MSKENNGGAAFPMFVPADNSVGDGTASGMSLRDYFAAKAIVPLLAGATLPTKEDRSRWLPLVADVAYEMADAMLAERDK